MMLEHEIPTGTKLYFGKTAKIKREIEAVASDVLYKADYEELITPLFSYHQHLSIADEKELIRVNDTQNHQLTLRADSTIDVVRLLDKRLGRNTSHQNGSIFNLFTCTHLKRFIRSVQSTSVKKIFQKCFSQRLTSSMHLRSNLFYRSLISVFLS